MSGAGRLTRAVLAGLLLAGGSGCASAGGAAAPAAGSAEGRMADGGVAVTVRLLPGDGDAATLEAVFRPQRAGFHLYSLDLPDGGVDGLGVPTRLAAAGSLRAAGRPRTGSPVRQLRPAGLGVALPVYPDGPVTVTLPVRRTGAVDAARAVVGYGACSESGGCLPPVRARVVRLRSLRPSG